MTLPDLIAHLTALADRVSHDDRFVIFEAIRRLQHGGSYVITGPSMLKAQPAKDPH